MFSDLILTEYEINNIFLFKNRTVSLLINTSHIVATLHWHLMMNKHTCIFTASDVTGKKANIYTVVTHYIHYFLCEMDK